MTVERLVRSLAGVMILASLSCFALLVSAYGVCRSESPPVHFYKLVPSDVDLPRGGPERPGRSADSLEASKRYRGNL
jgi:hypothetical protein